METTDATNTPAPGALGGVAPGALARLQAVEREVAALFVGREEVVRAALVALVAREHMALLGPPGTGKSLLVEALAERIAPPTGGGLRVFRWLLTRFTTPEELLGPLDLHQLKAGRYVRVTTSKLPEAELVLLDEVFKASSAILNALLTLLNERAFDNGPQRVPVPLLSCFGASNETPQGEDLAALWDRFGLRVVVGYVPDGGPFARLLRLGASATGPTTLPQADLVALQAASATLPIPDAVLDALVGLRRDLSAQGITASDRRWRQSLGLLRAHALLEGRAAVEEDDLAVLRDVLWAEPPQRQAIGRVVARLANPTIARAVEVGDEAQSVFDAWAVRARDSGLGEAEKTSAGVETVGKLRTLSGELKRLREGAQAQGRSPARVEREAERVRAMLTQVASEALGL